MTDGTTASWIQAGGVLAFASAVLWQLRDLKPILKAVADTLLQVQLTQAALLERERVRAEAKAARDAAGVPAQTWAEETTQPIIERATPPGGNPVPGGGYRIIRPGGGGRGGTQGG